MSGLGGSTRRGLWLGACLAAALMLLTCGGCGLWVWAQAQAAVEYRIPAEHRGWSVIRYEVPGCPPLRADGFTIIVILDASGRACTSSKPELRPADWHFVLAAADGSRYELPFDRRDLSEIQAVRFGSQNDPQTGSLIERFYVGTYADAQAAGAPPIR